MAILHTLGKLCVDQDLTVGAGVDSTNVINMGAAGICGFGPGGNIFLDIECKVKAGGTGTFLFDVVVAQEAELTNVLSVLRVYCADVADPRIAVAGRKIFSGELPDQVRQLARAGYPFLGILSTLVGSTATVSINAAVTPGRPRTEDNVQVTRSNVGLPAGA